MGCNTVSLYSKLSSGGTLLQPESEDVDECLLLAIEESLLDAPPVDEVQPGALHLSFIELNASTGGASEELLLRALFT